MSAPLDDPLAAARARLEASRLRMRHVMIPPRRTRPARAAASASAAAPDDAGGAPWGWLPESVRDTLDHLRGLLRKHPIPALLVDTLGDWWDHHPVKGAASVAGAEVAHAVVPLIRRHPVAAVGVAACAGAIVVAARPWRWRVFGGSGRPLPRRLASWFTAQIPLQALMGTLIAMLADQARQSAAAANPADPPPSPSAPAD